MASPPPASDAVRAEWLRRVQAEYTSAAITQHLGLWLLQVGASPDLVRAALRIVTDEVEHARLSHVTCVRAGGTGSPELGRERLELSRTPGATLESDVTRVALGVFCLGETVAVPLFKRLREGCTVPVARRALDRVLRDEVRHRDFGWLLLDWLLAQPYGAEVRALAEAELPALFARIAAQYGFVGPKSDVRVTAADRDWGLMKASDYGTTVRRTLDRDWTPRFGQRGIDAAAAWDRGVTPLLR
jgi:hypothetical protein